MDEITENYQWKRHQLWDAYNSAFGGDSRLQIVELQEDLKFNFGYFPLTVTDPFVNIDSVIRNLADNDIIVRKYFSPILNQTKAFADCNVVGSLKNAEKLNNRVLCLPIHEDYLPYAQFIAEKVRRSLDES